jgi:peptidoglycan/xylan/chitin deacetylase (PgdA/CDA1 family)
MLWRLRRSSTPHIAVLLYHHIGNPRPNPAYLSLTVTPRQFRRQVRWLHWRGYTAISSAQWFAAQIDAKRLPKKSIIFTFDDAYLDLATHALPVLEQYGFPSVVFAITGHAKGGNLWEDLPTMTMEQLRHWSARGVEIGAHTRTHPDLTAISDSAVSDELIGSRKDLDDAGLRPLSFAYPFGAFDARIRKLVDGLFPMAFTCEEGLNNASTDPLLLRRTMVHPGDTLIDIEFRAAFGKSPLDWLRTHVRLRSRMRSILRRVKPSA